MLKKVAVAMVAIAPFFNNDIYTKKPGKGIWQLKKAFDVNFDFSVLEKNSFDRKLKSIRLRPSKKSQ